MTSTPPPASSMPTILAGVTATVGLGYADYATGYELSFAIFYTIPVAAVAWRVGWRPGLAVALLSALTWHVSNAAAGATFHHPAVPYWNVTTRLAFFVIIVVLVARIRRSLERERLLSRTDILTGALNSRAFLEVLSLELARTRRNCRGFVLAYMDVDNFKRVNDTMGHSAGDLLLRSIADAFRRCLRTTDAVARLGGDEFAVLLLDTDQHTAESPLSRMLSELRSVARGGGWPVSFSVGAVAFSEAPSDAEEAVGLADQAMYRKKSTGKDGLLLLRADSVSARSLSDARSRSSCDVSDHQMKSSA
jgi:diguanylate cyclase (GGDEF)-like protein